jgi:signal transduction histidine kinase/uncharacterized protein YoaH (UPF0181 family)
MVHTTATALWFGLVVASAVVLVAAALRAREYWDEPGGETFSGLALSVATMSVYLGSLVVLNLLALANESHAYYELGGVLEWPTRVYFVVFPVLWGLFAAQRKGLRFFTRRRAVGVTVALLGGLGFLQAVHRIQGATSLGLSSGVTDAVLSVATTIVILGIMLTTMTMATVGIVVVLYIAYDYEHVSIVRGATLAVGAVSGWFVGLSYTFGRSSPAEMLQFVAVFSAVVAASYWLSVSRFDIFERSVAAGAIGRAKVVEEMEDAMVVADDEGEVLDLNPVATRLFELDRADAVGSEVEDALGEPLETLRTSDLLDLDTLVGVRQFEPRTSDIVGAEGTLLGFSVVLRDVTERRTREERLQVLNRVLRHNLRNEVSVISGYAELLGETGATVALDRAATEITETAYELAEIGEKARTIERMMAEPPSGPEPIEVDTVVKGAVERVGDQYSDCEFAVDVEDGLAVAANGNVLEPVLTNVVENAAQHNDRPRPQVEIRAAEGVDPTTVTITVVDDGPGIPEDEREVLDSGDVTPLEHGSGLGLWITKWGITRLGGELSFAATAPRGTIVTIRLPVEGSDVESVEGTTRMLSAD